MIFFYYVIKSCVGVEVRYEVIPAIRQLPGSLFMSGQLHNNTKDNNARK